MLVKQRRPSTNPYLRSLLQKTVRRGFGGLAAEVATKLDELGDGRWLRSRAVVLAYEECWPSAMEMALSPKPASKVSWLKKLAGFKKQKDAAGLGTLAYALSEGDPSGLIEAPDEKAVRIVAAAIQRPADFWDWAEKRAQEPRTSAFVRQARGHSSAPTWPWDKAFVMSAAYLATNGELPSVTEGKSVETEFPYWCAIDKHTPDGKVALANVAECLDVPRRQLIWASFYFESALVNDLEASQWWDAERRWRLAKAGLTVDQAQVLWERASPLFVNETRAAAAKLVQDVPLLSSELALV